ncbi:cytochrome c oxidase subunit NDUFA4-like [Oppia nitens]|uniref:cytochrome c oxidase subunit NDUFA4-like n=1 Tax=Oppia nitens TaxID=1686743 RepID=UPI0023DBDCB0|nr:cytochrome c oxidase subunit NDUFA4-like [Oppia nitens]
MSSPKQQVKDTTEATYGHMRMNLVRDRHLIWKGLRKNYAIWPLLVFAFGCAPSMIIYMTVHKIRNPDTIWSTTNPEPWNGWQNKREKLISFVDFDYKNYSTGRPDFEEKKEK